MNCNGHIFVNHKSEEMICWACGFVLGGKDLDAQEALKQLTEAGQHTQNCPRKWQGFDVMPRAMFREIQAFR